MQRHNWLFYGLWSSQLLSSDELYMHFSDNFKLKLWTLLSVLGLCVLTSVMKTVHACVVCAGCVRQVILYMLLLVSVCILSFNLNHISMSTESNAVNTDAVSKGCACIAWQSLECVKVGLTSNIWMRCAHCHIDKDKPRVRVYMARQTVALHIRDVDCSCMFSCLQDCTYRCYIPRLKGCQSLRVITCLLCPLCILYSDLYLHMYQKLMLLQQAKWSITCPCSLSIHTYITFLHTPIVNVTWHIQFANKQKLVKQTFKNRTDLRPSIGTCSHSTVQTEGNSGPDGSNV